MATATAVVSTALRKAGILAAGQTASAEELDDGLETLNDMMNAWSLDGIDIGWSDVALADTLPVPDEYLRCIKYSLAVELCSEYGKQAPQEISIIAGKSKSDIRKSLVSIPAPEFDAGVLSYRRPFNILND